MQILSFQRVDLREYLPNLLTVFERLEYHQSYRPKRKKTDILKKTAFMRNIDYARLRYCSLINLLKNEITSTSFCLTKDGFLRNPSRMNVYLKCQSVTNASGRF